MKSMATDLHSLGIPQPEIEEFCERNHIRKLSLFGSVLTARFRPDSDVDILVEFDPDHIPSYFELVTMEMDLSKSIGRKVDLRTSEELSRYFRDQVVASALPQYERNWPRSRPAHAGRRPRSALVRGGTHAWRP
jgi:uncharacterized protein